MTSEFYQMYAARGVEYLIALAFLVSFVPFFRWVFGESTAARHAATEKSALSWIEGFFAPLDHYFHEGHGWARKQARGVVRVGLDDFGWKLVGALDRIELPRIGDKVQVGGKGWTLHADGREIEVLSPVAGTVVAINERALFEPRSVEADPYGEGWLIEVRAPSFAHDARSLLVGSPVRTWMQGVVDSLLGLSNAELGRVLADGGVPIHGVARAIDPDKWDDVARDFFHTRRPS